MIISYREKLLNKKAESPNKDPWNTTDQSKVDKEGIRESDNPGDQTIIKLKMDKNIKLMDEERKFINWETLNQLDGEFEEPQKDDN